ncbi:dihydrofolate reductase family protein [Dyadobacter fermentans]|uniref:Bifunctional deaminase-reductase domain protein n=1 Tax=Dyadobacter fermentans (strain ATCC 700827 / DSM 18053 / CIP 107007 / KCTC 52180 / NS114) TaxID=471854 RepID=C6W6Z2_DYAFD|nr:dihydrofolate reductase family protein [Dyadobacter fermentans]ACT92601.1 bifunctional deaminase-reductase domain protein [Dyadobacter fermentans DSM 18053]
MRKIITNTFATLDGVIQAPGGPEEDRAGGFELGGWSFHYWDEIMGQVMDEGMSRPYDLLLGRKTYDIFAAHWPFMENDPTAEQFNACNKYVATQTLKDATWQNTVLLNGDTLAQLKALKSEDGIDLQVHGSADFIQTLLRHNLIDEMNIWIFPLVIGQGKKLFANGTVPSNLKLTKHSVSSTGVIMTTYVPDGEIKVGSFALEEPTELEIKRRESGV